MVWALGAYLAGVVALIAATLVVLGRKRRLELARQDEDEDVDAGQEVLERQEAVVWSDEDEEEDADGSDGEPNGLRQRLPREGAREESGPMTERQMRKAVRKREKREQRQAQAAAIQAQERRKAEARALYVERLAEREEERLERESAEREAEAKREREEQREYDSWRQHIKVEASGTQAETVGAGAFEAYVRERKVVVLEDLAAAFQLRTAEAVQRLEKLQEQGRLAGVFDERGKFVVVAEDELEALAQFVRNKGRVSLTELAAASNRLVQSEG